jgi:uncharacterized protein YneR
MSRYKNTNIRISKSNLKKGFSTTIYDDVPKQNDDMYVITQEGDRLDNLAFEYYGDQHFWWFIARANHINTMNLPAGTRLRIPISTKQAKGS